MKTLTDRTDQIGVFAMATLDSSNESSRQEDHAQDHHDE